MKILNIALHFSEYTCTLASGFDPDRHYVNTLVSEENYINELQGVDIKKTNITKLKIFFLKKPINLIKCAINLFKIYKKEKYDTVHFQDTRAECILILLIYLVINNKKYYVTIHDPKPHLGVDSKIPLHKIFVRNILRKYSSGYVCHGDNLRKDLELVVGSNKRILTMPHVALRANEQLNFSWEGNTVLFMGRVEKYKGLSILCNALIILQNKGVNFKFVIAGKGDDLKNNFDLIKKIKNIALYDKYIEAKEMRNFIEKSKVVVLPYIDGTQSGIGAMALGVGRALVGTDVGSLSDMVINGQNGFLVEPGNPIALADAIEKIILNDDLAKKYSVKSKEMADTKFSPRFCAEKLLNFYE